MEPEQSVMQIQGRCYRCAAVTRGVVAQNGAKPREGAVAGRQKSAPSVAAGAGVGVGSGGSNAYKDPEDVQIPEDDSIVVQQDGSYKCVIPGHPDCFGYVVGRKGSKKKSIEADTHTTLKVAKHDAVSSTLSEKPKHTCRCLVVNIKYLMKIPCCDMSVCCFHFNDG